MDARQWRRCVRLSVAEGALSTAMGTLLSGVFLTGFALSLGASPLHIGILAAMPPLASSAQLLGARWLNAGVNRKKLCLWSISASRLVWTAILVIPLLDLESSHIAIGALMVVVGASSVLGSLGGVAALSWIRDLVPSSRRFGFLGLRNQINTVLALALSVGGALFLDSWSTAHPDSLTGFAWVLAAAIVCGLSAIPVLHRLDDPGRAREAALIPQHNSAPLQHPSFRRVVSFYVCWNLANHLAAPFYVVFMMEDLNMPYWHITGLQAFSSILGLSVTQAWTALGRRIGTRRVVFLATFGDAFAPACWMLLSPETAWALPIVFLFGVFNTPLAVGAQTMVMQLAPDDRAASYLGTFNAVMGAVMGAAAIAGGYLADALASTQLTGMGVSLEGLSVVFLVSSLGRFGSLVLLKRADVFEPTESVVVPIVSETRAAAVPGEPLALAS